MGQAEVSGRFLIYVLVCVCFLEFLSEMSSVVAKFLLNSKSTSTQVHSKSIKCSCAAHFIKDVSSGDLCGLETAKYPKMHLHHQAEVVAQEKGITLLTV